MPWSSVISSGDVVAIHAAFTPTGNGDGEIVLFGGDNHSVAGAPPHSTDYDHTRRFNCRNPSQPLSYVQTPAFDVFCCGHAMLGDGRLLIAGGTAEFPADAHGIHHDLHFDGHRHCAAYSAASGSFTPVADMGSEPGSSGTGGGRWYPTLCTLATGEVLAFQGHPGGDDHRHGNNTPERYQPLINNWVGLSAVGDVGGGPIVYPRVHAISDGSVFVSSQIPGFNNNIKLNPWTGAVQEVGPLPDGAYRGFDCPSVLLPLVAADGYRPRVLLCGGARSQFFDFGNQGAGWQAVGRDSQMNNVARVHSCATLLPTGDVLLTGGTADGSNDQAAVAKPEIYRTPLNASTASYQAGTGHWETINEPATVLRNYHSSALLMPDGRVWTAGGNSPSQPGTPPTAAQKQIEIYEPPYPAGTRPTITSCPRFLAFGDAFTLTVPDAAAIRNVVLMRCGSSTHAYNPDQRAVWLNFEHTGATTLRASAPPSGLVAPPGNYMVFVVDKAGRPCQYAKFLRLGGVMSMFTNRSHFSEHEIQALLSGATPASVPNAFYVVLDGFSAADLGSGDRPFPPDVQFHFIDNNSTVPGMQAELMETLYESPAAPPYMTQRITLGFRLQFANTQPFSGIAAGDQRDIRIDVAWGSSHTSGRIFVMKREHVYALDGPTPWLSVDVRVLRLQRGAFFAGLQDNDPVGFIQAAITRMRSLPSDEFHPFVQLSLDQHSSALELSPTVGGVNVDNFAFAKVRFRAPAGIHANDVKVFFRLFATAVTNMAYDRSTLYPRTADGPGAVPLEGLVGGETASMPFFASARAGNPANNVDTINVTSLTGNGAAEVTAYFGCWLDFNHNPPLRDKIVRGGHQCLVAEIHYPPSPIDAGSTPANNDQLSQRNLAIVESDNPGGPAAHIVTHTFELKPSAFSLPAGMGMDAVPGLANAAFSRQQAGPDELFIHWHDLPRDAMATIYIPGLDMAKVLAVAGLRAGAGSLAQVDDHTVQCRVGDVSYLPLMAAGPANLPGLLTLQMPPTVRAGSRYHVSVHQVSGVERRVIGSFELAIPVSRSELLVGHAERELGVLKQIDLAIPPLNRWKPVFKRYLGLLSDRVRAFGGDPDKTPGGTGETCGPQAGEVGQPPGKSCEVQRIPGKVCSIEYDCFGDFRGFVLEGCTARHVFVAHERRLHDLVHEASVTRRHVVVSFSVEHPERALGIEIDFG